MTAVVMVMAMAVVMKAVVGDGRGHHGSNGRGDCDVVKMVMVKDWWW